MVYATMLDSLFDSLFYNFPKEIKPPVTTEIRYDGRVPKNVLIQVALAGFSEEDINIWCEDNNLCISGDNTKKEGILDKFKTQFEWHWPVSKKLSIENTKIDFTNGLLTIDIPVIVPEKKKIFLKGGNTEKTLPA